MICEGSEFCRASLWLCHAALQLQVVRSSGFTEILYEAALTLHIETSQDAVSELLQVALSLANLAALMQAQGKTAAAEELLRRALSIREDALGPDHPLVGIRGELYTCSISPTWLPLYVPNGQVLLCMTPVRHAVTLHEAILR